MTAPSAGCGRIGFGAQKYCRLQLSDPEDLTAWVKTPLGRHEELLQLFRFFLADSNSFDFCSIG